MAQFSSKRNRLLDNNDDTFLIAVATNTAADEVAASINWEEIT